jgi:hypothetical protein
MLVRAAAAAPGDPLAQAVEQTLKLNAAGLIHAAIPEKWAGACPNERLDLLG